MFTPIILANSLIILLSKVSRLRSLILTLERPVILLRYSAGEEDKILGIFFSILATLNGEATIVLHYPGQLALLRKHANEALS